MKYALIVLVLAGCHEKPPATAPPPPLRPEPAPKENVQVAKDHARRIREAFRR